MPLVIWAYPRGTYVKAKGGQKRFYAIDYAARLAMEMGADVVKLNLPKPEPHKDSPAPYDELEVTQEEAVQPGGQLGRALAGRALGRLEDRRRQAARPDALHHGGGRLGRDLRAQRLAARVVGGDRDDRADQGDHARLGAPDPLARCRRFRRSRASASVALLAILVIVLISNSGGDDGHGSSAGRGQGPADGIEVPVADVVDGDTIEVLVDGHEEDVRYIGIDTPESVAARPAGRVLRPRGEPLQRTPGRAARRCAWSSTRSAATSTGGCSPTSTSGTCS